MSKEGWASALPRCGLLINSMAKSYTGLSGGSFPSNNRLQAAARELVYAVLEKKQKYGVGYGGIFWTADMTLWTGYFKNKNKTKIPKQVLEVPLHLGNIGVCHSMVLSKVET